MKPLPIGLLVLCASLSALASTPENGPAKWITAFPAAYELALRNHGVPIWGREPGFVIGGADDAQLAALAAEEALPALKVRDEGQWIYSLSHRPGFVAPLPAGASAHALTPSIDLYLFPGSAPVSLPRVKPRGAFKGVARIGLPPIQPHPADLASGPKSPDTANPLVQQIVNATDQAIWFQTVKDLSGENPVVIGGQTWTISTRYSDSMFPTPTDNAHATEYLLDKGAGWGYTGVRETYTSADSGCGQSKPWQNVIFTIPGQVDFGQHQQVLFVNHYDSLSFSTAESQTYAPGADDAISGGVALLEAMRIFRNYAFKNTVKFGWFTGEEEGICGSGAYVRQHPSSDMWRVVNMDQTAFDGDGNRLMDVYNWDTVNSPASVAMGDTFVQANADYGNIIDPAKIVRDTSKMCQTDHCPFWSVGVAAIAVTEDLHNNDICPCFDQSQTSTCHDTVTQLWNSQLMFTQSYSWPSEKAAIATIAHLAEPLYACPPSAPDASAAVGNNTVRVTWPSAPGVTNYVVERGATCAGAFTALGSTPGLAFDDNTAVNGTPYAYRIRTCPAQTGACVTATPSASASVIYQAASAAITADSGDHDGTADNCETVTVQLQLTNDGNVPLTNVRLASVTSSNPAVAIVSALPQLVGSLGVGASAPASFKFRLGRTGTSAVCGESLDFTVTATSNESPASVRSFSLSAERTAAAGPLAYGFETDLSGWTVTSGLFSRGVGGAPGSTAFALRSRNNANDCNAVESPILKATAGSSMTLYVDYIIEAGNFDRAVARAVDVNTGVKTLLTPTGATYNTTSGVNLLCDNLGNLQGWSGSHGTWRQATFDLSAFAGALIKIELRYSTDSFVQGSQGFWFDNVQISNAAQIDCDAQTNTCAAYPPEVSPPAAVQPFTVDKNGTGYLLTFGESAGASAYNVYPGSLAALQSGRYDHASSAGLCGFVDGSPGNGVVSVTVAGSAIPDNAYLIVAAANAAGESKYGVDSAGHEIPIALSSCP